jgi:hypothetical protein
MGIGNFLKSLFPSLYDEYLLEKYKSGVVNKKTTETVAKVAKVKLTSLTSNHAQKISELPDAHFAKQYVINRKIPQKHHSSLFYTEDFAALVNDVFPGKYTNLSEKDARLVIPFFDTNGNVLGLQGRSLFAENSLRYITIRASSNTDLIYGLDRVDTSKLVCVVEGPIDSLFIPNCVAAANSDLSSALSKINNVTSSVLVFDNEPRNKEIVKLMSNAIASGFHVCVWPESIKQKDINDMVMSGISPADITSTISSRSFSGLSAELELNQWRKV